MFCQKKKKHRSEKKIRSKKKIGFYLDSELVEEFRRFVARKYGYVEKGLISREAELALRAWMDQHTNTQKQQVEDPPPINQKIWVVWIKVRSYLIRTHYGSISKGQRIHRKHLEEAIAAVRGFDKRTIQKWISMLEDVDIIMPDPESQHFYIVNSPTL